jgi:hypothetical protein
MSLLSLYSSYKITLLHAIGLGLPGWVPFKNLAGAEKIPGFIKAHDEILSFEFDTFIGGHLGRLGTREDVKIAREYISDVQTNAAAALKKVDLFAIANQTGYENKWLLFDTYLDDCRK